MCRCEGVVGEALEPKHTSPSHAVRWCQYTHGADLIRRWYNSVQYKCGQPASSNHGTQGCVASKARLNYAPPDRAEQGYGMDEDGTGVVSLSRQRRLGAFGQICRRVATKRPSRTVHQCVSMCRSAMLHPRCRSCKYRAVRRVSGWSGPRTRCWMAKVSVSKASASTALPCCL